MKTNILLKYIHSIHFILSLLLLVVVVTGELEIKLTPNEYDINPVKYVDGDPLRQCVYEFEFLVSNYQFGGFSLYNMPTSVNLRSYLISPYDPSQILVTVYFMIDDGGQGEFSVGFQETNSSSTQTGELVNFHAYNCKMSSSRTLTNFQSFQSTIKRLSWTSFYYSATLLNYTILSTPYSLSFDGAIPFFTDLTIFMLPTSTQLCYTLTPNYLLLAPFTDSVSKVSVLTPLIGPSSDLDILLTNYDYSIQNSNNGIEELKTNYLPNTDQYFRGWKQLYGIANINHQENMNIYDKLWFGFFDFANSVTNNYVVYSNSTYKTIVSFKAISSTTSYNGLRLIDMVGFEQSRRDFSNIIIDPISFTNQQTTQTPLSSFTFLNSLSDRDITCKTFIKEIEISSSFPFGYSTGGALEQSYVPTVMIRPGFQNSPSISFQCNFYEINTLEFNFDPPVGFYTPSDTDPPVLIDFSWKIIGNRNYIISISVTDSSGLDYIEYGSIRIQAYNALISGTVENGNYEFLLTLDSYGILVFFSGLKLFDIYLNDVEYSPMSFVYNFNDITVYPPNYFIPLLYPMTPNEISFFKFSNNQIDTTGKITDLSLFLQVNNQIPDMIMSLLLDIPFTNQKPYYSKYNKDLDMFIIDFQLPSNLIGPTLNYELVVNFNGPFFIQHLIPALGVENTILNVSSTRGDQMPPIISEILQSSSMNETDIQMKFTIVIVDHVNGFKEGMLRITSKYDQIGHSFYLSPPGVSSTPQGYTSSQPGSTIFKATYELEFTLSVNCLSGSTYSITDGYLIDNSGYKSDTSDLDAISPLVQIVGNANYTLTVPGCSSISDSFVILDSFLVTPSTLLQSDGSDKTVVFTFSAYEPNTGIPLKIRPVVYLSTVLEKPLECVSSLVSFTTTSANYTCTIVIPAFYGYNDGIMLSVFGMANNQYIYQGFNVEYFQTKLFQYNITWSKTIPWNDYKPLIKSILSPYDEYSKSLQIIAQIFNGDQLEASVTYQSGISQELHINSISLISYELSGFDTLQLLNPFEIVIKTNKGASIPFIVQPVESLIPETRAPKPIQCQGIPLCGGSDKGICSEELGCQCISPWTGSDCSAKILEYELPAINQTAPTYVAVLENEKNNSFTCKTFIHSLQEINSQGDIIATIPLTDKQWNFINDSKYSGSKSFQYSTVINQNSVDTKLNITLLWVKESKEMEFAEQIFTVSPYTYKYSITLSQYGFSSSLNTLKLIFDTDLQSNEASTDICSSKHSSTDEMFRYTRLKVNDMTLLSRYVNYAVIDNRNTIITNEPLNLKEKNTFDTSNLLVAINIPHYNVFASLDPDFSVLLESKPTNSETENSVCYNESNDNGLSKSQLAGIIVGSVIGGLCIIFGIVYIIFRKYKYSYLVLTIREKVLNVPKMI